MNTKTENSLTDQQLVNKVLHGDTASFSIIIKNTEALTAQIVFKMINNSEDRRDIAQDIYLKAYAKLSGFRFQSKLSTWIAQIAYNTCLNYLQKKKLVFPDNKYPDKNDEEFLEVISTNPLHDEVENEISKKELTGILRTEIENLPPIQKTLITLYHNEELSYEEIARVTELPEGTVKSYLFRARKALKENLLKQYKKEEL
ncbi:MAG: sigma-70 family RNA polymerase sigma factor [Bacteroidetes bacterium]|nr:sigma-70 family RNA polymerase sigma factor [Bacteroidota bacterium]MBS1934288.1 sigma-70 family RNA polymerase sigma factor [Bacteroidota bacterium]